MTILKAPSLALTIMFAIPFIQLGYSYYISISFGLFAYSFLITIKIVDKKIYLSLILVCILYLLKAFTNAAETSNSREILIPIREMICFLALIFISMHIESEKFNLILTKKVVFSLLLIILFLVIYQAYKISSGQYFGIPIEYFSQNKETLDGVHDALLYQTRFRPTSFFGEPSYTAFIVLSLLVICYEKFITLNSKILCTLIAFSIVFISQSLAGLLSIVIVFLYWIIFSKSSSIKKRKKLAFIIIFIILALASLLFSEEIFLRFANVLSGRDTSSNTRVSEPLTLLGNVISSGAIFGVNFQYMDKYLGYVSVDNALLRILIYYGILIIFPMIVLMVYAGSGLLVLYILISMSFNGEFFSYDKVLIVGMVIGLFKAKFINLTKYDRYSSPLQSNR